MLNFGHLLKQDSPPPSKLSGRNKYHTSAPTVQMSQVPGHNDHQDGTSTPRIQSTNIWKLQVDYHTLSSLWSTLLSSLIFMSCISLGKDSTPLDPAFVGAAPPPPIILVLLAAAAGPKLADAIEGSESSEIGSLGPVTLFCSNFTLFVPTSPTCKHH